MFHQNGDVYVVAGVILMIAWPLLWFGSLSSYRLFFGPEVSAAWTRKSRVVLALVSFAAGFVVVMKRLDDLTPGGMGLGKLMMIRERMWKDAFNESSDLAGVIARVGGAGMAVVLGIALAVKLYEKWINGRLSDGERQPGNAGVRAWLSGWNVVVAVGIALCVYLACIDWAASTVLVGVWILVVGVIVGYPAIAAVAGAGVAQGGGAAVAASDLTPQRERVLRMLEEGKITAEEAAELLSALGQTLPAATAVEPWTPGRKLMLAGAAVVLVGFFLPWFSFNTVEEMRRAFYEAHSQLPPGMAVPAADLPMPGGMTVRITGGDVRHGLGWIMLGLALGAAVTPYVATGLAREQRRVVMLVALAAGGIVGLYLLTGNFSRVDVGLPIVLVGYVVEVVGVVRDQMTWRAPVLRVAPGVA